MPAEGYTPGIGQANYNLNLAGIGANGIFVHAGTCPDSAAADIRQVRALIDQARRSSLKAVSDGDLTPADWETVDEYLTLAEANLSLGTLDVAANWLQQGCDFFAD